MKIRLVAAAALATFAALFAVPALAAPQLDGVLSDHAVIQRGRPIVVTGTAEPGETLTLTLAGESATAKAARDGRFRATLAPLPAGGPFELTVAAPSGLTILHDLLIGDVYLCSGQSNMELPVERAQDSYQVFGSADDQLRLLTVPKAVAFTPQARFQQRSSWAAAAPATAGSFSAACFYMVQELRKSAKVPIGAIHSSWGGSRISPWLDEQGLRQVGMGADADTLRLYARDTVAGVRAASARWEAWWREEANGQAGKEPWQPDAALDWQPVPRIGPFGQWNMPELAGYNGLVWFRNEVRLTAAQAGETAILAVGVVDDSDHTWVNGKPVGGGSSGAPRVYRVSPGTLVAGRNIITVNADNDWLDGGLLGPAEAMKLSFADGTSIPLGTGWHYAIGGHRRSGPPRAPWDDIRGAGTLYNAMIAPLGQTALAGVAWYQGESDTELPGYDRRLAALMQGWRGQFGVPDLPFAIIQLSSYGTPATRPGESGWAMIRNDQRSAAEADGHAAIVATLDHGDPVDIHPGEKHEVGRRAARAMRALVYRESLPPSGPRIASALPNADGSITLHFADVTGALETRSADRAIGFELCGPAPGSCRFATALPAGSDVALSPDGLPVTRVRYAWADAPTVNLFDQAGLPVGTFEIGVRSGLATRE